MVTRLARFLLCLICLIPLIASAQVPSTDTKDYQIARKRLYVGTGDTSLYFTGITLTLDSNVTHKQIPTARAVWEYIQTNKPLVYQVGFSSPLPDQPVQAGSVALKEIDLNGNQEVYFSNGTDWIYGGEFPGVANVDSIMIGPGEVKAVHLGRNGATTGQVMRWNGTAWAPATIVAQAYTTVQDEGSALSQRSNFNFVGAAVTATDDAANSRTNVTFDSDLNTIAGFSSSDVGLLARNAAGQYFFRTLGTTGGGISIGFGNGGTGNPTISLANDAAALEALPGTGIPVRTGANTWTQRSITSGPGIVVSNGDGVGGNPQITAEDQSETNELQELTLVGSELSLSLGGGSVTLPDGADGNGIYDGSGIVPLTSRQLYVSPGYGYILKGLVNDPLDASRSFDLMLPFDTDTTDWKTKTYDDFATAATVVPVGAFVNSFEEGAQYFESNLAGTVISRFDFTNGMFTDNRIGVGDGVTGLRYAADYSATFTDRSLVDKEYVDSHSGDGDGIYDGSGVIPGATEATLTANDYFSIKYSNGNDAFSFYDDEGSFYANSKNGVNSITATNDAIVLGNVGPTPFNISFSDADQTVLFTDQRADKIGLQYAAEYLDILDTDRSIPDVGLVNQLIDRKVLGPLGKEFTDGGGEGVIPDQTIAKLRKFSLKTDTNTDYNPDAFVSELVFGGQYNLLTGAFTEYPSYASFVSGVPAPGAATAQFIFDGEQGALELQSVNSDGDFSRLYNGGGRAGFSWQNPGAYQSATFEVSPDGAIFTDSRSAKKGFEYAGNYSATLKTNDRSLPDVGTVKLLIGSVGADSFAQRLAGRAIAGYGNKRHTDKIWRQGNLILGKNFITNTSNLDTSGVLVIIPRSDVDGGEQAAITMVPSNSVAEIKTAQTTDVIKLTSGSVEFNSQNSTYQTWKATGEDIYDWRHSTTGTDRILLQNVTDNTEVMSISDAASTNSFRIDQNSRLYMGDNSTTSAKLNVFNSASTTSPILALGNANGVSGWTQFFHSTATPEGSISSNVGDLVPTTVGLYEKMVGTGNTGYAKKSGVMFTQTADKTVTNTTTETSLIGTGVGATTLPSGFFIAGRAVRIKLSGVFSTPGTPGTMTVKVKLGSTVLASKVTSSLVPGGVNDYFDLESTIICRATGGSGSFVSSGKMEYQGGTGTVVDAINNSGSAVTVATNTSQTLDVTVTWDTADAAKVIKSVLATIEVLN